MGQISSFHAGTRTLLVADPYFADISVISVEEKDFVSLLEEAIARIGICVSVMTPRAKVTSPNIPGPYFDLSQEVFIGENVIINRGIGGTGKKASDVAETVAAVCHLQYYDGTFAEVMLADEVAMVDKNDEELIWRVTFKTSGGVQNTMPTVATPGIADNGAGQITLTCATGGAAMFYTTDGTFPSPRNGTLYTAPFAVVSGTKVRVTGWLAGYAVSAEAQYTRP